MKNGFTLIELLAIIIILAIIFAIAFPIIGNAIEQTRKTSFGKSARMILKAGEIYFDENFDSISKPIVGSGLVVSVSDLQTSGNLSSIGDLDKTVVVLYHTNDGYETFIFASNGQYVIDGYNSSIATNNIQEILDRDYTILLTGTMIFNYNSGKISIP